ncbi:MAG: hypothetical protein FNNCIFGK_01474 [Bacteroidia bacterium]|nr:MAG: hypothetical protein UZ10_BCD003000327 [Bacteroidetes bacterium OLB10]MBE7509480.1 hypothetical protein [Bacteroidia bacterium]MBV6454227.1 hypothetical protein [Bacteroidia bacterium]MBX3105502.1 hypothetical protein [Bacteroidota bacterium]
MLISIVFIAGLYLLMNNCVAEIIPENRQHKANLSSVFILNSFMALLLPMLQQCLLLAWA